MSVETRYFGQDPNGNEISCYILQRGKLKAVVTDWGATLLELWVPDKEGVSRDVVLGYPDLEGYLTNKPHFGATIGRYANRIAGGSFSLGGKSFQLKKNHHGNNLHSGPEGYDIRLWEKAGEEESAVTFSLDSPDMDQGFPGRLEVKVRYGLEEDGLRISYEAYAHEDTFVNLTNHSYFNLNGADSGRDVLDHIVRFAAFSYTPVENELAIPTGQISSVSGTPLDFTIPTPIGERIESDHPQMIYTGGYDHNYVLKTEVSPEMLSIGVVYSLDSGIRMSAETDSVGFQFYTANGLSETREGKYGRVYGKREAFCIETQFFPDGPNKPSFPSPLVAGGERRRTETFYRFDTV